VFITPAGFSIRPLRRPSLHFGPFFLQFAAEQYLTSFARSVPIFEQVFTGHLTDFPLAPLAPPPWAFAPPPLNKNGNIPMAAIATIFRILIPPMVVVLMRGGG
jgi:hypothetical protein